MIGDVGKDVAEIVEQLEFIRADPVEPSAATGQAGTGDFVLDPLVRQKCGQRLAAAGHRAGRLTPFRRTVYRLDGRLLGLVNLEVADQQRQLQDTILRRELIA